VAPPPIVDLNRAIAVAFSEGPNAGLALLDTLNLGAQLGEYHLLHATRADLLRSLGRPTDAPRTIAEPSSSRRPTPSAVSSSAAWTKHPCSELKRADLGSVSGPSPSSLSGPGSSVGVEGESKRSFTSGMTAWSCS